MKLGAARKQAGRAAMPEEVHDRLTDHAGGIGRGHGSVPLQTSVEAVARIRFPVRLPAIAPA
jgi:hypothetical protein